MGALSHARDSAVFDYVPEYGTSPGAQSSEAAFTFEQSPHRPKTQSAARAAQLKQEEKSRPPAPGVFDFVRRPSDPAPEPAPYRFMDPPPQTQIRPSRPAPEPAPFRFMDPPPQTQTRLPGFSQASAMPAPSRSIWGSSGQSHIPQSHVPQPSRPQAPGNRPLCCRLWSLSRHRDAPCVFVWIRLPQSQGFA